MTRGRLGMGGRAPVDSYCGQAETYPCFCLCFGLLHKTRTTPRRRMTLHFSQRGRTDARTFTVCSLLGGG
jgi:hypothetical protein